MKHSLITILYLIILQGCLDDPFREKTKIPPAEGELLRGRYFNSKKIGWTITLPKGDEWKMIPTKEHKEMSAESEKNLEDLIGTEIRELNTKLLISFRKDGMNNFTSTIQILNDSIDGSYDQMLTSTHQFYKDIHKTKNIDAEYELSATRIDGVMMDKFDIILSMPGKGKLYQHIYSCLIKDHILAMTITADNKKDDKTLLNVAFSSKFAFKE